MGRAHAPARARHLRAVPRGLPLPGEIIRQKVHSTGQPSPSCRARSPTMYINSHSTQDALPRRLVWLVGAAHVAPAAAWIRPFLCSGSLKPCKTKSLLLRMVVSRGSTAGNREYRITVAFLRITVHRRVTLIINIDAYAALFCETLEHEKRPVCRECLALLFCAPHWADW